MKKAEKFRHNSSPLLIFLKTIFFNVVSWFRQNAMVVNPDKFQLILQKYSAVGEIFVTVGSTKICNIDTVKLLGILVDSKLSFIPHLVTSAKKFPRKPELLHVFVAV